MTDIHADEDLHVTVDRGRGWSMASGILSIVLALLAFADPFAATAAATIVTGAYLMVWGLASISAAAFSDPHGGRLYASSAGILSLVVGGMTAFSPVTGAISLSLLVAIWLAGRGVMEIVLGVRLRTDRWTMLVLGALDAALAIIVLATLPSSALDLPGYVLGLSFMFTGILSIVGAYKR